MVTRKRQTSVNLPQGAMMRAMVQRGYGAASVLTLEQIPRPAPAPHQVLVQVRSAGLDRGAWHIMTGKPYLLRLVFGLRTPRQPVSGQELAGTVVDVGTGVRGFRIGDEVFGIGAGAFAEYAVAREDKLAHKPPGVSSESASIVPVSAVTALQALREMGRVKAGQSVLVIGASGGVGSYAVQLAKHFGAKTTGVCSTQKLDFVRSLGADQVVDYTTEDYSHAGRNYDLILDIGGNSSLHRLRGALRSKGTAVIIGGEGAGDWIGIGRQLRAVLMSPFISQNLRMFVAKERSADLELLGGLVEAGVITPQLGGTYPLDQTPQAMRRLEEGAVSGKLAVRV
ncbi:MULTISPECIES: NAD(P)-dependent alcohol dehydrogenase [unclassified Arthrobacter]|uniref:NAD(P)-dependent alcohol dehydrogenase n=1 Tax=unclassified Arthrobacter TaxID=235627 RepID=UPI0002F219EC|nr:MULTISPECIES: NAD(P)-dependent alcohol dehydrogenase [unclassified Arthrobacter]